MDTQSCHIEKGCLNRKFIDRRFDCFLRFFAFPNLFSQSFDDYGGEKLFAVSLQT